MKRKDLRRRLPPPSPLLIVWRTTASTLHKSVSRDSAAFRRVASPLLERLLSDDDAVFLYGVVELTVVRRLEGRRPQRQDVTIPVKRFYAGRTRFPRVCAFRAEHKALCQPAIEHRDRTIGLRAHVVTDSRRVGNMDLASSLLLSKTRG